MAILLCFFCAANAQVNDPEQEIQDIIESQFENLPEDYDLTGIVEVLGNLRKRPLDLNNASAEDLGQIFFLSPLQISNLLLHIKENGKLADLLELQTINGFDLKTIQSLLPFVSLKANLNLEKINFKNLSQFGSHDFIIRLAQTLEKQKGFTDLPGNRYLGSPEKMQFRYKFQLADVFAANLTMDKDAGEQIFDKRVDFISGNMSFYKLGRIKKLVIGDYNLQFGQGLTLWTGFSFGKSPEVTSVAKKDLGLRRYSSTNEFSFLRGASATVNVLGNIFLTPFVSFRKLDANQSVDGVGNMVQATINQTGLHRTKTELENRNSLSQQIFGAVAEYKTSNLNIGLVGYRTIFGNGFITQSAVYDSYSFTGKTLTNIGLHYNYSLKNFYLFGEGSKSLKSGTA
ncbi:MAG: helix-hairpin-helix domain-containing protein, partial [Pedobacter sp.]|nr:helix-hairpin-helix domain-containing protein [Pedobacter sp.]